MIECLHRIFFITVKVHITLVGIVVVKTLRQTIEDFILQIFCGERLQITDKGVSPVHDVFLQVKDLMDEGIDQSAAVEKSRRK